MKITINFSISEDDTMRYRSSSDLRRFYQQYGCSGLEVMPLESTRCPLIATDMAVGVHACCITDWMDLDQKQLLNHYWKNLDYAKNMHAEYVVFHVTQVSYEESLTYVMRHTNEEVIDAAIDFINRLLDGQHYHFHFLMENLWWPGLTFEDPALTRRLLDGVHYPKKGLMLDTGHFMNTNINLKTPEDALNYLNKMLDRHEDLIPMIKGIHLNQSLSGTYVHDYLNHKQVPCSDPHKLAAQAFTHIFRMDQHQPFTVPGVSKFIKRIHPLYVTLEYITANRKEHSAFLKDGVTALRME